MPSTALVRDDSLVIVPRDSVIETHNIREDRWENNKGLPEVEEDDETIELKCIADMKKQQDSSSTECSTCDSMRMNSINQSPKRTLFDQSDLIQYCSRPRLTVVGSLRRVSYFIFMT